MEDFDEPNVKPFFEEEEKEFRDEPEVANESDVMQGSPI